MKDLKVEEPKVWIQKVIILQYINDVETSKKAWKKKKKSWYNQRKNQENFTSAIGVNTTDTSRENCNKAKKFNTAEIIYYCYKNKGQYINKCPKLKN